MYQPNDVFLCSARPLQFWFYCKMSIMFNSVMFIETVTRFEILVAKITFKTLMAFQLCLFHEVWQTLGTFEGFCFNCQLGILQFFFEHSFLLCKILQPFLFIIWNLGIVIFLSRIFLECRLDRWSGVLKILLHPESIK